MFAKFIISLGLILGVMAPVSVLAATDPYQSVPCTSATDSVVCQTQGNSTDPISGPKGILVRATNIVAYIAGIAGVLFIVFAGIKYTTSQGDPQEVSKAKQSIIYALIGLLVVGLARQIINFVLTKV
jgi:hypothetical protein